MKRTPTTLVLALCAITAPALSQPRPNIVIVLADDMGLNSFSNAHVTRTAGMRPKSRNNE